ncbi:tripartite tricarboxylate transporter TctB family protein [Amycolatopsis palatopharyngis]|uniref:tripartite tricarboxylate transporter TctB family protein n=1 Tax=Amycolatopsis palatopharyngis TaxID=187982 RepID=UPI000E25E273|nr:tripartite tricarboxylate transporter TctB family protein [Amycolatopsis palatopharyngis]
MINAKRDCVNALVVLTFSAVLYFSIDTIPDPGVRRTGAAFFPKIVVPVLALLGFVLLVDSVRRIITEPRERLTLAPRELYRKNRKVIYIFLACGAYVPALYYLGYLVSTPFFLLAVYFLLARQRTRRLWAVILGYLLFTAALYVVFQQVLYVFLPPGRLFF